jgi:hypothetical protein
MFIRVSEFGTVYIHLITGVQMDVTGALSKDTRKEKGLAASSEQVLLSLPAWLESCTGKSWACDTRYLEVPFPFLD